MPSIQIKIVFVPNGTYFTDIDICGEYISENHATHFISVISSILYTLLVRVTVRYEAICPK